MRGGFLHTLLNIVDCRYGCTLSSVHPLTRIRYLVHILVKFLTDGGHQTSSTHIFRGPCLHVNLAFLPYVVTRSEETEHNTFSWLENNRKGNPICPVV